MKKNLKVALRWFNGSELTEKTTNDTELPIMISDVVAKALFEVSTSAGLTPEEKYQAFKISQRIMNEPRNVELDASDVVLIRKVIGPSFSAGVYGQIIDLLES